jgi:peptide-methionine (R)-S-oxide reductase
MSKIKKTDAEWKEQLTPQQYHVMREHGTERPFTHPYTQQKSEGVYTCAGCGAQLFSSETKFEDAVNECEDRTLAMHRTEVRCASCEAHLGHVFPDGPKPTGLRYCMNGTALNFKPEKV